MDAINYIGCEIWWSSNAGWIGPGLVLKVIRKGRKFTKETKLPLPRHTKEIAEYDRLLVRVMQGKEVRYYTPRPRNSFRFSPPASTKRAGKKSDLGERALPYFKNRWPVEKIASQLESFPQEIKRALIADLGREVFCAKEKENAEHRKAMIGIFHRQSKVRESKTKTAEN